MKGCIRCHGPLDSRGNCDKCDRVPLQVIAGSYMYEYPVVVTLQAGEMVAENYILCDLFDSEMRQLRERLSRAEKILKFYADPWEYWRNNKEEFEPTDDSAPPFQVPDFYDDTDFGAMAWGHLERYKNE